MTLRGGRQAVSASLAAFLALVLLCGGSARAARSPRVPTPSAALAWKLAGQVDNAGSTHTRVKAVLATVEALGWPVAGGKGGVVWSGARGMPAGFMMYPFELTGAARAMGSGSTFTPDALAVVLANGGLVAAGKPLPGAALQSAIRAAVSKALRKPNSAGAFVADVVRDLGLRRHKGRFDLAKSSTPASAMAFDPVQALIIGGDLAIGAAQLRANGAADVFTARGVPDPTAPIAHIADHPCQGLDSIKEAMTGGKLGASILGGVVSETVRLVVVSIDAPHGVYMATAIAATPLTSTSQSTHYGPAGHTTDAGKALTMSVEVFNYSNPDEFDIHCGPLLGMKFPPYGPMKGIGVTWSGLADVSFLHTSLNLGQYGTVSYNPEDQQTGHDGVASLVFTPKDEEIPGFGTVLTGVNTSVYADVHYASAIGNILTAISTLLIPLEVRFYTKVTAHVPRGFKFGPAVFNFTQSTKSGNAQLSFSVKGQLCGQDPWSEPWTITETLSTPFGPVPAEYEITIPKDGVYSTGSDFVHLWALPPPAGPYPANPFKLNLTLSPDLNAFNGTVTPSSLQINSDVTEDTTCPIPGYPMWQPVSGAAHDR